MTSSVVSGGGRYQLYDVIAEGGMAAVHLARVVGSAGFSRIVAVKRLHPHLVRDPKFATMFLDEARVASRVQHPNVVGIVDVVAHDDELLLVMEYVRGEALSALMRESSERGALPSIAIVSAIVVDALYGLHAAHEARDEQGQAMEIVHRDVSPQNVLVGTDGVARVVDFGIAKAISRLQSTQEGEIKGKLSYLAPEQLRNGTVDRRTDVYAASVVLWGALTGRRLFASDTTGGVVTSILEGSVVPPSKLRSGIDPALDALVLRGLSRDPDHRFGTALEMAEALAEVAPPAPPRAIGAWVSEAGGERLAKRTRRVIELEQQKLDAPSSIRPPVLSGEERRKLIEAETDILPGATELAATSTATAVGVALQPGPVVRGGSKRWRWLTLLAALLVAALGATAAFFFTPRQSADPEPEVIAVPPPSPSPEAPATPEPQASIPEPEPEVSAPIPAPAPAPAPAASPAPAKRRPSTAPRPKAKPTAEKTASAAPTPPSAPPPGCDPPYTIDKDGIKRFKRWCGPAAGR